MVDVLGEIEEGNSALLSKKSGGLVQGESFPSHRGPEEEGRLVS